MKINNREPIKINFPINAEIRSDLVTLYNLKQRIKFATNATKGGNYAILCNFSYFNAIKDEQDPEQSIQDTDMAAYLSQLRKTTGNDHKRRLNKTTTSLHQGRQRDFDGNYSTQMTQA